jgi:hypothetical protein
LPEREPRGSMAGRAGQCQAVKNNAAKKTGIGSSSPRNSRRDTSLRLKFLALPLAQPIPAMKSRACHPRQLLLSDDLRPRYEHGGELSVGKRKKRRPISLRQSMHLVFRSEIAKGPLSLLVRKHVRMIDHFKARFASRFHVRIYEYANSGNHLHLLVRARTREGLQNFLRAFAGQVALKITRTERGNPFGKFWSLLVYSRIVAWGRAYRVAKKYILQNRWEGLGLIPYRPGLTSGKSRSVWPPRC